MHATLQSLPLSGRSGGDVDDKAAPSAATGEASLGSDAEALHAVPLWFKKDAFTAEEFDAEEYARNMRRYVTLGQLQAELERHLVTLKAEVRAPTPQKITNCARTRCDRCRCATPPGAALRAGARDAAGGAHQPRLRRLRQARRLFRASAPCDLAHLPPPPPCPPRGTSSCSDGSVAGCTLRTLRTSGRRPGWPVRGGQRHVGAAQGPLRPSQPEAMARPGTELPVPCPAYAYCRG